MKLWVDDERPAPDDSWVVSKTSGEAKARLWCSLGLSIAPWDEISLDHDLGGEDTGMLVLDYMAEHGIWPRVLTIHTANPPARDRMLRAANAEAPDEVDIFVKYW